MSSPTQPQQQHPQPSTTTTSTNIDDNTQQSTSNNTIPPESQQPSLPPITSSNLSIASRLPHIAPWKTTAVRHYATLSKWLTIDLHSITIPASSKQKADINIPDWAWLDTPDWINVAICTADQRWLIFYQSKYAIGVSLRSHTLAPVGGYIDKGEDALTAAKREMLEETGYVSEPANWIDLGASVTDANRGCGVGHLFAAFDAKYVGHTVSDDLEEQHALLLTSQELEDCLLAGDFKCQGWVACCSLALMHQKRRRNRSNKDTN